MNKVISKSKYLEPVCW